MSPFPGAEINTFLAPASICFNASSYFVKCPVHSNTTSTPNSFRTSGCGNLDYEIEKYDGSEGDLVAWVRIPTRPQRRSAISRTCVHMKKVTPLRDNSPSTSFTRRALLGSSPTMGSSRNTTLGLCRRTDARTNFCRMPWE